MRILALDDYGGVFRASTARQALLDAGHVVDSQELALRGTDLVRIASGANVLLLTQQRTPLPREVLSQLPSLRWIVNTGRNTSHIDADACAEQGIHVVTAGGGNPHPAAELTWALILAASRKLLENSQALKQGFWQASAGISLQGKTLGIYGVGHIGEIVATVGSAFGMRVLCYGRSGGRSASIASERGFEMASSRDTFFAEADVLSLHVKDCPETRGTITQTDLALMKPSALFVNTSRAGLVQEGALLAALQDGRPGFAAIDVFEEEPAGQNHPLLQLPNVLATPHLGYVTTENLENYYSSVVSSFLRELESGASAL